MVLTISFLVTTRISVGTEGPRSKNRDHFEQPSHDPSVGAIRSSVKLKPHSKWCSFEGFRTMNGQRTASVMRPVKQLNSRFPKSLRRLHNHGPEPEAISLDARRTKANRP